MVKTEMTDRQLLKRVNADCQKVLAETRAMIDQHKLSLDDDAFHYLVHSQNAEEHWVNVGCKRFKPASDRVAFMGAVLWMVERHKEYIAEICQNGLPEHKPYPPVTEYDRSIAKLLHDNASDGYLERGEDGSYLLTDEGKGHMARSVMFLLRDRDVYMHHAEDLWKLNGLREDDERSIFMIGPYHNQHFWPRVRNALLLRMTDEQLKILRTERPKPLKVKVSIPVWVEAVMDKMFEEVIEDNLKSDTESVAWKAALRKKYEAVDYEKTSSH